MVRILALFSLRNHFETVGIHSQIMADNFVHLLLETPELPDPQILEQMREVLTAD